MVESKRFQAQEILVNNASLRVSYGIRQAQNASDALLKIENRRPWNLDYLTPLQRFLKRRQLEEMLQNGAEKAGKASYDLDILELSSGLHIESSRKRPRLGRPYDADELVGYVNNTFVVLEARRQDGRVTKGHVNGVDIRDCTDKNHAQSLFDAFYPVVLKREQLAASLHRNSQA